VLNSRRRPTANDVIIAVLLSLAATAVRYTFDPTLGFRAPLLFHILAVAVSAQIAGTLCGVITTGFSAVLIDYFFIAPTHSLALATYADVMTLLIFLAVGIFLSIFSGRQRHTRQALRDAYERIALKHEVARMGTFDWYVQEGVGEWSPEMEKIYGIKSPDHIHAVEEWKNCVYPDDLQEVIAVLEETQRTHAPSADHTYRIIRSDGRVRWIHSRRKYEYDSRSRPIHVRGINIDVTELKEGELAEEILGGLMQVCSSCRRIRDQETDAWYSMEGYLRRHSSTKFSHGMCPDCCEQWFPEEENHETIARRRRTDYAENAQEHARTARL
jgi:PAS domain S-box-containing protein